MSLFFRLLPSDLQIHVLSDWICRPDMTRTLLLALSTLDIACTNGPDQRCFRALAEMLPPFGDQRSLSGGDVKIAFITSPVACLCWLANRKIRLRAVAFLGADAVQPLKRPPDIGEQPHNAEVETILWRMPHPPLMEKVLRSCPNLTSLDLDEFVDLFESVTIHLPKLKEVRMNVKCRPQKVEFLERIGHQLQKLMLPNWGLNPELVAQIGRHCINLRHLTASGSNCASTVLFLLQSCTLLEDLKFTFDSLSADALAQILATKQVKRFDSSDYYKHGFPEFTSLLELRPDIEHLTIDKCTYSHDAHHSCLRLTDAILLDGVLLSRVFDAIKYVDSLAMTVVSEDAAHTIAESLAGCLNHLEMVSGEIIPHCLAIVLGKCGLTLTYLHLSQPIGNTVCRLIAAYCPLLESLHLDNDCKRKADEWTDDGIIAILDACPNLKGIKLLHMSRFMTTLLEYILVTRRVLEHLVLSYSSTALVSHDEIGGMEEEYRQLVKECQLLPVPKLCIQLT